MGKIFFHYNGILRVKDNRDKFGY